MTIDEFNTKAKQITGDYLKAAHTVLAKFNNDLGQLANDAETNGLDEETTTALLQVQLRRIHAALEE